MKVLAQFLLIIFLYPVILLLVLFTPLYFTLLSSSTYKDPISESEIYSRSATLIADALIIKIQEQTNEQLKNDYGVNAVLSEEIQLQINKTLTDSTKALITPEILQKSIDNNVDNFIKYANKDDELYIYIPKTEILDTLEIELPILAEDVKNGILSIRTCTEEETQAIFNSTGNSELEIDCMPSQVKDNFLTEDQLEVIDNVEIIRAELESSSPILSLEDRVEFGTFLEALEQASDNPQDITETMNDISQFRDYLYNFRFTIYAGWGITFIVLILLGLLFSGNLKIKIRNSLLALLPIPLIVLISSLIVKYSLLEVIFSTDTVNKSIDTSKIPSELLSTMIDISFKFADGLVSSIVIFNLIIVGATMFFLTLTAIIKSKNNKVTEVKTMAN